MTPAEAMRRLERWSFVLRTLAWPLPLWLAIDGFVNGSAGAPGIIIASLLLYWILRTIGKQIFKWRVRIESRRLELAGWNSE